MGVVNWPSRWAKSRLKALFVRARSFPNTGATGCAVRNDSRVCDPLRPFVPHLPPRCRFCLSGRHMSRSHSPVPRQSGGGPSASSSSSPGGEISLAQEEELRFEVPWNTAAKVKLMSGDAWIFGTPLLLGRPYTVRAGSKIAIFSWKGALLDLRGSFELEYKAPSILAEHILCLEDACSQLKRRILIVGPPDSGKFTLARTFLCHYHILLDRTIGFVSLDLHDNQVTSLPGTISACIVDRPIDIETGFQTFAPLTYFYGQSSLSENEEHVFAGVDELAKACHEKYSVTDWVVLANAGSIDGPAFQYLLHCARAMRSDYVVVVGDDRLQAKLRKELPPSTVVAKVNKSGGVVIRDAVFRDQLRASRFKDYFYGPSPTGQEEALNPVSLTFKMDEEVRIVRIGGGPRARAEWLPFGSTSTIDPLKPRPITDLQELNGAVLAISCAQSEAEAATNPIAGAVFVQVVDAENKEITVLAPSSSAMPSKILIAGSTKWIE